jgi:EAL domain-containing protein (putative c-di-GMP-specific phosphodiesterase class I)
MRTDHRGTILHVPRHSISVELTEQAAITNLASAKTMVARLGASECGFARRMSWCASRVSRSV